MAQDDLYRGDAPQAAQPRQANSPGPQAYGAPPGYGAPPAYGPPPGAGYGPPPGYGYQPPGYPGMWRRPTNGLAIAALVMAFVFAPVGIILGVIARKQIRETGEEGDGLALAGVIVGAIVTGFYVLMIVFMIAAFSAASSYTY